MAVIDRNGPADEPRVEPDFLRRALDEAHLNALRLALFQQTGKAELAQMPVIADTPPGSPNVTHVVDPEFHQRLRKRAFDLLTVPRQPRAAAPTRSQAAELMALFQGGSLEPAAAEYGYEELAFDDFPREAVWRQRPAQARLDNFTVAVIGAGFSGILAGIQLSRLGIGFRIVERQAGIGGTWELNDYPEARVDITTF